MLILAPRASVKPDLADAWNPGAAGSGFTFSSGNTIAEKTYGSSWQSVRSNNSFATGNKYAECKIIGWTGGMGNGQMFGCANAALGVSNYTGNDNNSFGLQWNTAQAPPNQAWIIYQSNSTAPAQNCFLQSYGIAIGRSVGFAMSITSGSVTVWFTVDGVTWNNGGSPGGSGGLTIAITGPLFLASSSLNAPDAQQLVAQAPFVHPLPAGFTAWS